MATDLEDQFAKTFEGFNKTAYDKALDGYYSDNLLVKTGERDQPDRLRRHRSGTTGLP